MHAGASLVLACASSPRLCSPVWEVNMAPKLDRDGVFL